jgi:hypothetical protein
MRLRHSAIKARTASHREPPRLRSGTIQHYRPIRPPKRVTMGKLREWLSTDTRTMTIGRNSLWRDNQSIYLLRGGKQYHFKSETQVWEFYFKTKEF